MHKYLSCRQEKYQTVQRVLRKWWVWGGRGGGIPICCYWSSPQKQRPAVSGSFNSAKPLQVKYSNSPSFHGLSEFSLLFIAYSTTTIMCLLQLLHCKDKILNWENRVLTHTFLIPRMWQLQIRAQRRKKMRWELSSVLSKQRVSCRSAVFVTVFGFGGR